jgi:hypothetical protein
MIATNFFELNTWKFSEDVAVTFSAASDASDVFNSFPIRPALGLPTREPEEPTGYR